MGAILRAYEAAKALGEQNRMPFALAGSHWLLGPNGEFIVNSDGSPHTYWDCQFVLQTTLDSDKRMHDGIKYKIEFFGGYDGVWISRNDADHPYAIRYFGFNVGDSPHSPFFGYDYRGQEWGYDDVCGDYKEFRQQNAYKDISVWECFDAQMLLNLVNGDWKKFLGIWRYRKIKPTKSHVRMANAIKSRLIRTLLHHEVIEKKSTKDTKYSIHWSKEIDFAEFEDCRYRHSLPTNPQRNANVVRKINREKYTYNYVGIQRKEYPMKRRPTIDELQRLMGLGSHQEVKSLMEQNGFVDTFN